MLSVGEAHARAALAGNPSDGYNGKTLGLIIKNFSAKACAAKSERLIIRDAAGRQADYSSLGDLVDEVRCGGFTPELKLAQAAIKKFADFFERELEAAPARNFCLEFDSNIPRQVGLAGSSAIVTAVFRCLMGFFGTSTPKEHLPGLILSVEAEELGISAGLQDRVAQVYEGLTYMDFDAEHLKKFGFGRYESIDPAMLPKLYLAYQKDVGESSDVFHSNIKRRFDMGDAAVIRAMNDAASCAERARQMILERNWAGFGQEVDRNFDIRRRICELDPRHIEMVETARSFGASANFAGSGGAIIGTYDAAEVLTRLSAAFEAKNCAVVIPVY